MKKFLTLLLVLPLLGASCLLKSDNQAEVNQPAVNQPDEQKDDNGVAVEVNATGSIDVNLNEDGDQEEENKSSTSGQVLDKDDDQEEAAAPKTYQISIDNFRFSAATLKVKPGDKIIWTNNEAVDHTVNSNDHPAHQLHASLNLGTIKPGATLTWTADESGTWGYHCHLHPSMTGVIIVE